MLNLSRHVGQTIKIGDEITITLHPFKSHGEVRLGIAAPSAVPVHRSEIYDRIQRAKPTAEGRTDARVAIDSG